MTRTPPSVNLVVRDNALGLSRDAALLAGALRANGCSVHVTPLGEPDEQQRWRHGRGRRLLLSHWRHRWARWRGQPPYDLNIMFEHVWPLHLPLARYNIALPNPEWFDGKDAAHLRHIDQVWVKTHHAEKLFRTLGCKTSYVGFDSDDRYDPRQPRERSFFHLAGGSRIKGTERLLALWRRHPEWPTLIVVQNPSCAQPGPVQANIRHCVEYLAPDALQAMQNGSRFHLCPSEAEGWGHYIVEAMSVGAVVIATDTAPMNEMISAEHGLLVPCTRSGSMGHATTHHFDETAMEQAVTQAMAMSDAQIQLLGERARTWFLDNRAAFPRRIAMALAELNR